MDYRAIFEVSAAGMTLEKTRLDVAALNLAHMHSSAAPGAALYQPQRVVASTSGKPFTSFLLGEMPGQLLPAGQVSVVPTQAAPRLVPDAGHPHADAKGLVRYPGVDQAAEMITAMTALRAYEANVAAVGFAKAMVNKALDIGGSR